MEKSKDQELLELQQKVRLLERKNTRLEKELELKDIKVVNSSLKRCALLVMVWYEALLTILSFTEISNV